MKLLFDQNLSYKLCAALQDIFPGSTQVRLLGLDRADDREVWRHAAEGGFALVTQDADFRDLSALYGAPPKVVLIRRGNQTTGAVEQLLRSYEAQILDLEAARETHLLAIE